MLDRVLVGPSRHDQTESQFLQSHLLLQVLIELTDGFGRLPLSLKDGDFAFSGRLSMGTNTALQNPCMAFSGGECRIYHSDAKDIFIVSHNLPNIRW